MPNVICSECETENPEGTSRCKQCKYPLAAEADVERIANALNKKRKKAAATTEPEPEKKGGIFESLE